MYKKIDENSVSERKKAHDVFYAYLKTKTRVQYNKKINELDEKYDKTDVHLKAQRYVYYTKYATNLERRLHDEKTAYYSSKKPKYILFCDELFQLSENERISFVSNSIYSSFIVKKYLQRYKQCGGRYSDLVDSFYEEYCAFLEENKKSDIENKELSFLDEACAFYQDLIDLGFYTVQDYINYFVSDEKSAKRLEAKSCRYKKFIIKFNPDLWEYYSVCMENNRVKTLDFMKDRINIVNERIRNTLYGLDNFDVIDYYILIGMPIMKYKRLCKDYIDLSGFNNLFASHICLEKEYIVCEPNVNSDFFINGKEITLDDKNYVLNFLYQHNIPYFYFNSALNKYVNGGLEQYVGSNVKSIGNK